VCLLSCLLSCLLLRARCPAFDPRAAVVVLAATLPSFHHNISRDVIFNEAELAGNKDVRDLSQGATAPATTANNASTIPATTEETDEENMKDSLIVGRTRKATNKVELSKKVLQEAVGATETPIKLINAVVRRRDPNIVYKEFYEKDPPLPKAMIAKLVSYNEDKPSYETAIAGPETLQWRQGVKKELNRILELDVWNLVPRPAKDVKIFISKWAFARKRNEHNEIVQHKARLILKGYEQVTDRDYDETYAAVIRNEITRLLLSLAAKYDWKVN
jgi:hypothetical protein